MKVGDIVYLSPTSRFVGRGRGNPSGVEGRVTSIGSSPYSTALNIRVDWNDGTRNSYAEEDLTIDTQEFLT